MSYMMVFINYGFLFDIGPIVVFLLLNSWSTYGPENNLSLKKKTEHPLELK